MNKLLVCFFLMITFSCYALAQEGGKDNKNGVVNKEKKYQVSIYELVANQEKFDEKPVYVAGYAGFYTDFFLFSDKTSCLGAFLDNSIAVDLVSNKLVSNRYEKVANKYEQCDRVIVFGEYVKMSEYDDKYSSNLLLGVIHVTKVYDY